MTDLTKLADALQDVRQSCAPENYSAVDEVIRILRSADGVDVAGLMAIVQTVAFKSWDAGLCAGSWNRVGEDAADAEVQAAKVALESALRLALAAREWQPIETAPKDGRQLILLLTPSGFPQVAYSNTWWTAGFSVECKPTHWMPLPAAAPKGTT